MEKRYGELDSLRGIAALTVFFCHISLVFKDSFLSKLLFEFGPFRWMVAGSEAVTLFFLLSGFVLSLSFFSNKKFSYSSFIIRRICRIYIPYIFAITFAYIAMKVFYSGRIDSLSDWFNANWSKGLSSDSIIKHIVLIGTFTSNVDNVIWSLIHEMRISIIFPFIMLVVVRKNLKYSIGFALLLSGLSVAYAFIAKPPFMGTELYTSIHYASIFIVGALLAKHIDNIKQIFLRINYKRKLVLFLIGFILFDYAHPSFILNRIFGLSPFIRMVIDTWFTTIGASILIIFALLSVKFSSILRKPYISYIGKISYSLYLIHVPIILSCIHLLKNTMPIGAIIIITIPLTIAVSSILYYLVEKPAIKLGKKLTGKQKDIKNLEIAA